MDERFRKEEGPEIFSGNEAVLKGALEAGCSLITGYPGSPVSELFDAAFAQREVLARYGILAELANNEALAAARLNGARMAGVRAMAVMKSVGLHVAADGLALGNLTEPDNEGGSLVVVGDDPWIESTQINNDSRFLSQHLHMPVLEPATFQEIKDWVDAAFSLSSQANLYLTYLLTTPQADGGGTVWVHPNREARVSMAKRIALDSDAINLDKTVLLPPRTWSREKTLAKRFDVLLAGARQRKLNRLYWPSERPPTEAGYRVGFVVAGMAFNYFEHALRESGRSNPWPVLKLGMSYPVDPVMVRELAQGVNHIVVIEEKRAFIETQVADILRQARQAGTLTREVPVWGKQFPQGTKGFPVERGLSVAIVKSKLEALGLIERPRSSSFLKALPVLPARTPTFCPGCPHRDSSSVFLEIQRDFRNTDYMRRHHGRDAVDLIFHGETGCFTMLMFEPNQSLMHNYSGMGIGGGTGAGADPFITNKQVVFLGDSTFFHSGLIAISDSLKNNQDITYVILDNKTTAMTGHQPTPGTEANLMGEKTFAQNIEAIVRAMAGQGARVTRMNPGDRQAYRRTLESTILQDGVQIIIADKECGLTLERTKRQARKAELRHEGFLAEERLIRINPEACEFCLACTQTTGCPGLTFTNTSFGLKVTTDPSICVADGACAKVRACPAFEEVTVKRTQAPQEMRNDKDAMRNVEWGMRNNKDAMRNAECGMGNNKNEFRTPSSAFRTLTPPSGPFYVHIAGVGGQGAGFLTQVIVMAAHAEGWRTLFTEKKGLAIRNGAVYSQIVLTRDGGVFAPQIPEGQAHLVLGLDRLEAARSLDPQGPLRVGNDHTTVAMVNEAVLPTIRMLTGRDALAQVPALHEMRALVGEGRFWSLDCSRLAVEKWGQATLANVILLGAAVQRGELPLSVAAVEEALRQSLRPDDRDANLDAFAWGRRMAAPSSVPEDSAPLPSVKKVLREKAAELAQERNRWLGVAFRRLMVDTLSEFDMPETLQRALILRTYELFIYGGTAEAKRYIALVRRTLHHDQRQWGLAATQAVIEQAFRVMAIKDEVYVAHLLTSREKRARDAAALKIDTRRGDRIRIRHFNSPEFVVFGRRWRWHMQTRDWQLHLMKRMRFLRRWLPAWHAEERAFRDWYLQLARQFDAADEAEYRRWVDLLNSPEPVRGYREVRARTMAAVRQQATAQLAVLQTATS